jgi:hypothetical protein
VTCLLDRNAIYRIGEFSNLTIVKGDSIIITGHTAKILNPPKTCTEGVFSSHKATVNYDSAYDHLSFNQEIGIPEFHLISPRSHDDNLNGIRACLLVTGIIISIFVISVIFITINHIRSKNTGNLKKKGFFRKRSSGSKGSNDYSRERKLMSSINKSPDVITTVMLCSALADSQDYDLNHNQTNFDSYSSDCGSSDSSSYTSD